MIQQFKSFNIFNVFLLLIITYVLRIGLFVDLPENANTGFAEVGKRLLFTDTDDSFLLPITNIMLAGIITFVQALLFNRLVNNHSITGKPSFVPALIYVTLSSVFTPFLLLSPPLICNFFVLFILYRILESYKAPNLTSTMLDLGMITAIATIFYFPFVFYILILWVALLIFRAFNWREWVAVILGYLTIVFFLAVYYYWNDRLSYFFGMWKPLTEAFPVFIKIQPMDYIVLFPVVLGLALGAIQLRENFFRSYIQVRKTFMLLFYVFIFSVLAFYVKTEYNINHFILCIIPVATLLSYYFIHATKKWFYESIYLIIAGFIIYFQTA